MTYVGDYLFGASIPLGWTSNNSLGAAATPTSLGTVQVYRYNNGSISTTAVGVSENSIGINGLVGFNRVTISSASSSAFYSPHCDFHVVGSAFTIDGQLVGSMLGRFSIDNRMQPGLVSRSTLSGAAAGTATLNLNESATTDLLAGAFLVISTKTQGRAMTAVAGATRVATLDRNWTTTPAAGDPYAVYVGSLALTGAELADSILTRNIASGSDGGRNVSSALMPLRNKVTTGGSTITVFSTDDTTSAWTGSITTAGSALASIDPA